MNPKLDSMPETTFWEVCDKLEALERPYYHACAGGTHFHVTPEWEIERERLIKLFNDLFPFNDISAKVAKTAKPKQAGSLSRFQRLMEFFK
jgi:hypothetical protein